MTTRTAAVLRQMREAVSWIESDVEGFDVTRFVDDRRARQLVERNLEILSEASRRIPPDLKATEPDGDWTALAIGNVLRHEYQRVDAVLLWTLLADELDALSIELRRLEERSMAAALPLTSLGLPRYEIKK
jgi:uncharacterized protein with HEPN domain